MTNTTNDPTLIRNQIQVVIEARKQQTDAWQRYTEAFAEWERKHKNLYEDKMDTAYVKEQAEATLRNLTLAAYEATGERKPAPGVEVKMFKVLNYELLTAYKWAVEHELALQLDKKVFETIAKANPPDFVTITEEPKATIATDLEKAVDHPTG